MTFHNLALWFAIAAVVGFAAWAVLIVFVAAHSRTGHRQPSSVSAGLELGGDSTPAVAAMLANNWVPPHAAAAATFLDLAARNVLTLSQSNDGPVSVQCGPNPLPDTAPGYERQVYDLVVAHAGDGIAPCSALALGRVADAERWSDQFSRSVIDDAREHGLSRPLLSSKLKYGIALATAVPAAFAVLAIAAGAAPSALDGTIRHSDNSDIRGQFIFVAAVAALMWAAVTSVVLRMRNERATPAGATEAARWLGLRDNLTNDVVFRSQPAMGIAVWDRLLAYGVGLGVARNAARDVPITAESQREAWSDVAGTWRLLSVRYPSLFPPGYGQSVPMSLVKGLAQVALSMVVLVIWLNGLVEPSRHGRGGTAGLAHSGWELAGVFLAVAALLLLVRGVVQLALLVWDAFDQNVVEGRVVRYYTSGFVSSNGVSLDTDLPRLFGPLEYGMTRVGWRAAVDDGSSNRIDAWFVSGRPPDGLAEGCNVRATVTAHLHRVVQVSVVDDVENNAVAQPTPQASQP